jgi:hypothetical protein
MTHPAALIAATTIGYIIGHLTTHALHRPPPAPPPTESETIRTEIIRGLINLTVINGRHSAQGAPQCEYCAGNNHRSTGHLQLVLDALHLNERP